MANLNGNSQSSTLQAAPTASPAIPKISLAPPDLPVHQAEPKPNHCIEAFVANKYVRKMYEEMKDDQQAKYNKLDAIFQNNVQRLMGFIDIADNQFPKVKMNAEKAVEASRTAREALQVQIINTYRLYAKRKLFKVLHLNGTLRQRRRFVVGNMLHIFRRY